MRGTSTVLKEKKSIPLILFAIVVRWEKRRPRLYLVIKEGENNFCIDTKAVEGLQTSGVTWLDFVSPIEGKYGGWKYSMRIRAASHVSEI